MKCFLLTKIIGYDINNRHVNYEMCQRDIVQLVERWSPKPNVEGSSPSVPVKA